MKCFTDSWTPRFLQCCALIFILANLFTYLLIGSDSLGISQFEEYDDRAKENADTQFPSIDQESLIEANNISKELRELFSRSNHLKIYVSSAIKNKTRYQAKYPGSRIVPTDETQILNPYAEWFWFHDEYYVNSYIMHRAHHDELTFTENLSQADLCYPSCEAVSIFEPARWQVRLKLQVAERSLQLFSGCKEITVGIESPSTKCTFAVPYWHSIYAPSRHAVGPWSIKAPRHNLLCFIGGSWRGKDRKRVILEMRALSDAARPAARQAALFSAPFFFESRSQEGGVWGTPAFFARVWALYAGSAFSWQPSGDTGTRRGLYDSWMLGCIPVVSRGSAATYRRLFRGRAFAAAGVAFEDVAVVLDDDAMLSGAAILGNLTAIPPEEVRRRRRGLARLAPLMQWGYDDAAGDRADALLMALSVALAE